jgi:hypothetical protein
MYLGPHVKYTLFFSGLNETLIFSTDFRKKKYASIKFNENLSDVSQAAPSGQTRVSKLIVTFRKYCKREQTHSDKYY